MSTPSAKPLERGWPEAITKDVAREIRAAVAALGRADDAFRAAGVLPPEVLADVASDPFHGKPEQEPDWFIEPLLTSKELSSVLRLPPASVRSLGIKSIRIAGEVRYRQSVVRAYLIEQEKSDTRATTGTAGFPHHQGLRWVNTPTLGGSSPFTTGTDSRRRP